MEIQRCASRRSGAEWHRLVPERSAQLTLDADGRWFFRVENVPSPRDEDSQYDYKVYLNQTEIELLRSRLAVQSPQAE